MENLLLEKIKFILDKYTSLHAKAWEIGTDFFMTWKRIGVLLENVQFNDSFTKIRIKEIGHNSSDNEIFQLIFGTKNITPRVSKLTKSEEQFAAEGTIRQYLQEGSALSYIAYSENDKIQNNSEFSVSPQIWKLRNQNNFKSELVSASLTMLKNSVSSNVYWIKNIGYSLFLSLVAEYDWEIFKHFKEHFVERINTTKHCNKPTSLSSDFTIALIFKIKGTTKKQMDSKKHLSKEIEEEFKKFGNQVGKKSYETACSSILEYYSFEEIIDEIYFSGSENVEELKTNKFTKETNLLIEKEFNYINSLRSQFRERVFKDRKINDLNKKYCDLSNAEKCNIRAMDLDACHIYDVEKIKKRIQNLIITNNYQQRQDWFVHIEQLTSDPNNCLLMSPLCHKMFDRSEIWFDTQGKLCYRKETEQYVKDYFSNFPELVCIKKEIFNEQMKQHLINKISENNT